ncbi:unnamed protein product [Ectocarpus sp. 12 AP-2014]
MRGTQHTILQNSQPHTLASETCSYHPPKNHTHSHQDGTKEQPYNAHQLAYHNSKAKTRVSRGRNLGVFSWDREERLSEREEGRTHHHVYITENGLCCTRTVLRARPPLLTLLHAM